MTNRSEDRSDLFVRFHRRSLIALMVITLLLGTIGLALALSPTFMGSNFQWWLLPIVIAGFARLVMTMGGRPINTRSPELKVAVDDEWRRTNMFRAARGSLIVVLVAQWPLGLIFGFLTQ